MHGGKQEALEIENEKWRTEPKYPEITRGKMLA